MMSQKERILQYMRMNDGITSMDAFRLGCTRLAARISDLRKDGYNIYPERVTENRKTYVKYHLRGRNGGEEDVCKDDHRQ